MEYRFEAVLQWAGLTKTLHYLCVMLTSHNDVNHNDAFLPPVSDPLREVASLSRWRTVRDWKGSDKRF